MKAVQYSEYGGPEVLKIVDLPDPHPGPGEVRISVKAVGINPIDWKLRSGWPLGSPELPQSTGHEAAGVVDELGEGVSDVAVGDRVFGPAAGNAGAAELAVLTNYATIPQSLDFTEAAALPVAVETATRCLDLVGVDKDTTLLINGAAGAVGSAVVQLAGLRGARVIGTASPNNHDYLRSLGAEPTTYGEGLVEGVRAIEPDGVDAAIDAAGGGALPALVDLAGGPERVLTIADFEGAQATGVAMSGGPETVMALHALHEIGPLIEDGSFKLPVAQTFALDEIADAHRVSEEGHVRGKLVLTMG